MRTSYTTRPGLSGAHIENTDALFTLFEMTVHAYAPHTKGSEALRLIYTESLLSGCGKYSKDRFIDALTVLGSEIRVSTAEDAVHFSVRARNENLKKTLALFTEMLMRPTFATYEIARIKTQVSNNLQLAKEDARKSAYAAFVAALVSKSDRRFSYDIDTTIAEIKKINQKDIEAFHKNLQNFNWNYTYGGSMKNCIAVEKVLAQCKGSQKKFSPKETALPVVSIQKTIIKLANIPHKQNIEFSIGGPVSCTVKDPEYPALFFGMAVLGIPGGFTGRLMSTVREKEGLTYGIYGQLEGMTAIEMGYWKVGTFFSPKDTLQGIASTLREIKNIASRGITADELRRFKIILNTRFAMVEDSLIKKVRETHGYTSGGVTEEQFESFKSEIQHMTIAKVNSALKKYLNPKKLVISGAGPIAGIEKAVKKFAQ